MVYRFLADALIVFHFSFILFVVFGGFLILWNRMFVFIHLPAAFWGALIEFKGWICPLTPLENSLRRAGGQAGYPGGFVEHYLIPVIYPAGLTPQIQYILGSLVILTNICVYAYAAKRKKFRGR